MSEFTVQFKTPRRCDVCVTLAKGVSIADARSNPLSNSTGRFFCDLAALYQENEQIRSTLDRYDFVIIEDGAGSKLNILFETKKAREARIAYEKESAYGLGAPDGT